MSTENQNIDQVPPQDGQPAELVPKDVFEKTQKELTDYRARVAAMEQELKNSKINVLKEKENWQDVARTYEMQAKEYEQKYTGLKDALVREKKYSAIKAEAQRAGISPHSLPDLDLLDFDDVLVETTNTGRITIAGADRAIENLKRSRPHWFTQQVPNVNPISPSAHRPGAPVSLADLETARKQWETTKSPSDRDTYYAKIQEYKKSNF